jgi:hypothetical protein
MKTIDVSATSKTNRIFRFIDYFIFTALMIFLAVIVISSSTANIQTDSIDYYTIVQKLTQNSGNPIVRNQHFVEQRSPGYPIVSLIPYYLISSLVEPFVQTEEIVVLSDTPNSSMQAPTEKMLLPSEHILFRDIFFKNFYIEAQDSWFEWKIIASLLLTSYSLMFFGLIFTVKTLALENKPIIGASLAPLVAVTSVIFMHNIVNTPAYATLAAFGMSGLFGYFFVKGSLKKKPASQFLSGLFAGLLILTRLETIIIAAVVLVSLVIIKEFRFLKNFILGTSIASVILLLYNFLQFGNPFYFGILKGDINLISLNWGYIYNNLFNTQSGILFWSTLVSLGIVGLFLDNKWYAKILGISSLALITIVLIRVPVMYTCIGEGVKLIGGLPITCPNNMTEMITLIRSDANRYITVLIPFSVIGFRTLIVFLLRIFRQTILRQTNAQ